MCYSWCPALHTTTAYTQHSILPQSTTVCYGVLCCAVLYYTV